MSIFSVFSTNKKTDTKENQSGLSSEEVVSEEQQFNNEKQDMIRGIEDLSETSVKEV